MPGRGEVRGRSPGRARRTAGQRPLVATGGAACSPAPAGAGPVPVCGGAAPQRRGDIAVFTSPRLETVGREQDLGRHPLEREMESGGSQAPGLAQQGLGRVRGWGKRASGLFLQPGTRIHRHRLCEAGAWALLGLQCPGAPLPTRVPLQRGCWVEASTGPVSQGQLHPVHLPEEPEGLGAGPVPKVILPPVGMLYNLSPSLKPTLPPLQVTPFSCWRI